MAIQKTVVGIRISILDIPCVPIFSQNEQLETEKRNVGIRINIVETLYANFQPNWTFLGLSIRICPKMDLGFEIQKTNVGTRIRNLEIITCVPIFR